MARLAGVSHQTVSRVLNEHPNVRPLTRERVLDAIREPFPGLQAWAYFFRVCSKWAMTRSYWRSVTSGVGHHVREAGQGQQLVRLARAEQRVRQLERVEEVDVVVRGAVDEQQRADGLSFGA